MNPFGHTVAVHRSARQRLQNQQVERSLHQVAGILLVGHSASRLSIRRLGEENVSVKFFQIALQRVCSGAPQACGATVAHAAISSNLPMGSAARYRIDTAIMTSRLASPLRIALIGMSGAGKTFWTKRLAASGHPYVSCDDQIERRLQSRLATGGYAGINGVAAWMGWPDSPTYAEREAEYLA